jgi:hypothetical protein
MDGGRVGGIIGSPCLGGCTHCDPIAAVDHRAGRAHLHACMHGGGAATVVPYVPSHVVPCRRAGKLEGARRTIGDVQGRLGEELEAWFRRAYATGPVTTQRLVADEQFNIRSLTVRRSCVRCLLAAAARGSVCARARPRPGVRAERWG